MEKSSNPSSIRSRKMIIEAFLELLKEKPYNKITITEIVNSAQLVRKTFYRNFSTKDEVLDEYVGTLFEEYLQCLSEQEVLNHYIVTKTYFEFWLKYLDILNLLKDNNLLFYILKKYDEYLPIIRKRFPCFGVSSLDETSMKYHTAYSSGGFWKILCEWVMEGAHTSPSDMAKMFDDIMTGKGLS